MPKIEDFLEGFHQPHRVRHADQRAAGRHLVIPKWLVRRREAGGGVAPLRIDAGQLGGLSFGVPVRRALPGVDRFIQAFRCPSRPPIG